MAPSRGTRARNGPCVVQGLNPSNSAVISLMPQISRVATARKRSAADPFGAFVSATELSPAMFGALGVRNPHALPRFSPLPACWSCAVMHWHRHAMPFASLRPHSATARIFQSSWALRWSAFGPRASGSAAGTALIRSASTHGRGMAFWMLASNSHNGSTAGTALFRHCS
jgi:hypothetical protein